MKRILYYTVLKYTEDNLKYLTDSFWIEQIPDPRWDNTLVKENCEQIEAIFFPLGYRFGWRDATRFPNLKVVATNTTNTDNIGEAVEECDIQIISLKGDTEFLENITPTAEHTWGLIHACHRQLITAANFVSLEGKWDRWVWGVPKMLSRMTLGIVGMGRVGGMVRDIGEVIMDQVHWYDPAYPRTSVPSILEIASKSDILTIHASNEPENKNMINSEVFNAMPRGSIVINTAHGDLLNIYDLLPAMKDGQIRAAALDVLPGEYRPDFSDGPVLKDCATLYPRLILTPHIGGEYRGRLA